MSSNLHPVFANILAPYVTPRKAPTPRDRQTAHYEAILSNALKDLNARIDRGWEFPGATASVCDLFGVNVDDLRAAYDAQFEKGTR